MVDIGLDRIPTSIKDALLETIAERISSERRAYTAQSRRYLLTCDETARSTAIEALGREQAYQDVYQLFNDKNPRVEKQ